MDLISLLVLVGVIVVAFVFKVNTGLAAIFASLVLTFFSDAINEKFLIASFDSKMFLMLFGVMFLFCLAQENKTLDVFAKKVIGLCGGMVRLFPVILFLLGDLGVLVLTVYAMLNN